MNADPQFQRTPSIKERLESIRLARRWTWKELACQLKVARSSLFVWCNGQYAAQDWVLERIKLLQEGKSLALVSPEALPNPRKPKSTELRKRLERIIRRRRWTWKRLATELQVARSCLYNMGNGLYEPKRALLKRIAFLEITGPPNDSTLGTIPARTETQSTSSVTIYLEIGKKLPETPRQGS